MKIFKVFILGCILLHFNSCSPNAEEKASPSEKGLINSNATTSSAKSSDATSATSIQKLIKTGNLTIQSKNFSQSKNRIIQALTSVNGFVANESSQNDEINQYYNLELKIPVENFDRYLSLIDGFNEKVINKSIEVMNVTQQYYDEEIRI